MVGLPEIIGLVKVLLVKVSVVSTSTIRPEAFGNSIVLSAVGSITVNVVSCVSAVVPSNTIEVNSAPAPAVIVGLVIIGDVKVLAVRV
jgi:hypothetical protein